MDLTSTFGKRLHEYRKSHGLTLDELSEVTGVPAQTLNRYELGQREPKIDMAAKIAGSLDVNPRWLFGYDANENDDLCLIPTKCPTCAGAGKISFLKTK